jgi:type IV secretion system protein VirB4
VVGFDVTEFLEVEAVRTPVTLYLFHLVRQALDGRRLVVWMDEFAKLLGDPAFAGFARDGLKTWRKLNAVAAFATQSPSDVLASPIARTLVEQTPTKVLFPNVEAQRAEYVEGFGLSEREFELVGRELTPGSRRFLVKQGYQGIVCELDLKGFEHELAVISGRAANVQRVEQLIADFGDAPEKWLPAFRSQVEAPR